MSDVDEKTLRGPKRRPAHVFWSEISGLMQQMVETHKHIRLYRKYEKFKKSDYCLLKVPSICLPCAQYLLKNVPSIGSEQMPATAQHLIKCWGSANASHAPSIWWAPLAYQMLATETKCWLLPGIRWGEPCLGLPC